MAKRLQKTGTGFLKDFLGNFLGGVDSGVDPHLLKKSKIAWAVNSTVRGGFISPMPKILTYQMSDGGAVILGTGETQLVSTFIQSGVFQGAAFYSPKSTSILPAESMFALISGRFFAFTPDYKISSGSYVPSIGSMAIKEFTIVNNGVPDLSSLSASQAWLGQAENYMIVQDGISNALIFDGNNAFRSSPIQTKVAHFTDAFNCPVIGQTVNATTSLGADTIPTGPTPVAVYAGTTDEYLGQMTFLALPSTTNYSAVLQGSGTVSVGDTVYLQSTTYPISNSVNSTSFAGVSTPYLTNLFVSDPGGVLNSILATSGLVSGSIYATVCVQEYAHGSSAAYGTPPTATGKYKTVVGSIPVSSITSSGFNITLLSDPYGNYSVIGPINGVPAISISHQVQSSVALYSYTPVGVVASASAATPSSGYTSILFETGALYGPTSSAGTVFVGTNSSSPSLNNQYSIAPYSKSGATYYLTNNSVVTPTTGNLDLNGSQLMTLVGIPIGKCWAYNQCRIWTTLATGNQFVAGDIVGGASGTSANNFIDAILHTQQNLLLSNGGTFSIPGNYGQIKAMVVAPTLNVALGQGSLQVFTSSSVFSVNAPTDIATWSSLTTPIIATSLIGAGGISQSSAIQVNSDILFRSQDGIRSMTIASVDFYKWNHTPCSQEVKRIIGQDDTTKIQFSSACFFDNRALFGCTPASTANGVVSQNAVVINLDTVSNLQDKAPAVWDGVWSGLNALQFVTGLYGNLARCFVFNSFNGQMGVSELLTSDDGQDVLNTAQTTWQVESPVLFDANEMQGSYELLRLEDGEVYFRDIIGAVTFTVDFRPDYSTNWYRWYSWSVDNTSGNFPYETRMGLGCPIGSSGSTSGRQNRDGYDFQVRITVNGSAQFMGMAVKASIVPESEFAKPIVATVTPSSAPVITMKQVFCGYGVPTTQNPGSSAGIYIDLTGQEMYLWQSNLSTPQWDGGFVPTGATSFAAGRQAFNGSGAPTVSTPTPANSAGTYFDYAGNVLYYWNPAIKCWDGAPAATGSGTLVNTLGSDYLSGHGAPASTLKPANGAGIYYDLDTLTVYNWNPITNTWI